MYIPNENATLIALDNTVLSSFFTFLVVVSSSGFSWRRVSERTVRAIFVMTTEEFRIAFAPLTFRDPIYTFASR